MHRLSLVAASGGCPLVVVCRLLIVVASLVVAQGSRAQAQELWRMSRVAPQHVESSQTRDQTGVPCICR